MQDSTESTRFLHPFSDGFCHGMREFRCVFSKACA
jgi:hypothetical protein